MDGTPSSGVVESSCPEMSHAVWHPGEWGRERGGGLVVWGPTLGIVSGEVPSASPESVVGSLAAAELAICRFIEDSHRDSGWQVVSRNYRRYYRRYRFVEGRLEVAFYCRSDEAWTSGSLVMDGGQCYAQFTVRDGAASGVYNGNAPPYGVVEGRFGGVPVGN